VVELDGVTVEEHDGSYVTTGASFRFSQELASGIVDVMETKLTIDDINLAPDFDAMNAFKFSVPDGMQVLYIPEHRKEAVPRFEWRDGALVSSTNDSNVEAIKNTVVALSEGTIPPRPKP